MGCYKSTKLLRTEIIGFPPFCRFSLQKLNQNLTWRIRENLEKDPFILLTGERESSHCEICSAPSPLWNKKNYPRGKDITGGSLGIPIPGVREVYLDPATFLTYIKK